MHVTLCSVFPRTVFCVNVTPSLLGLLCVSGAALVVMLVGYCQSCGLCWPLLVFHPVSLPLGPVGHCNTDGVSSVPAEAEETVSVGSCFASEDTTEDSGVMSSPSDIISLDSQHDSTKSKDKWATDQEDCSDQEVAVTPELGPQRSPSWERSGSGNWHSRWVMDGTSRKERVLWTWKWNKNLHVYYGIAWWMVLCIQDAWVPSSKPQGPLENNPWAPMWPQNPKLHISRQVC